MDSSAEFFTEEFTSQQAPISQLYELLSAFRKMLVTLFRSLNDIFRPSEKESHYFSSVSNKDQSSYNPSSHKATTIQTLTRRAQLVCDSADRLANENNYLDNVFNKNNYNKDFG